MVEIQSQPPVDAPIGTTGSVCTVSGPYICSTSPSVTMFIKQGQKFPLGPSATSSKGQTTTWSIVNTE